MRAWLARDSWNRLAPCDALLICNDSDRGYVFRGKRYAQLIDSLGDRMESKGVTCSTVARGLARLTGAAAHRSPASINRVYVATVLGQRLRAIPGNSGGARDWRFEREAALWTRILGRCRPSVVIAIQPDSGVCRAASRARIPIFDLQHGIIDTEHNPYYSAARLGSMPLSDLPTGFLVWDDESRQVVAAATGSRPIATRVIGNPWFARFLHPDPGDALVTEAKADWPEADGGLPTAIVTLQHGLDQLAPDYVRNGVMADALVEAILRSCDRIAWKIRLHPSQTTGPDASRVQGFLRKTFGECRNVDWETSTRTPLPLLLSTADVHVTHYSATTIEAAWLGLHTGLLDPHIGPGGKHSHFLASERARGLAHPLPLDAAEIEAFVGSALARRREPRGIAFHFREQIDAFAADVAADVAAAAGPSRRKPAPKDGG